MKRVHQLAQQLRVDNKALLRLLQSRGYEVKSASSQIDDISAEALLNELKNPEDLKADATESVRDEEIEVIQEPLSFEEVSARVNSSDRKERAFTEAEMTCKTTAARVRRARMEKNRGEQHMTRDTLKDEVMTEPMSPTKIELPYLYFEGADALHLAERFLVAPDFAATISNNIVTRSAVSVHPLTWSRSTPDRKFFEVWGASDGPGRQFLGDLKSLNARLAEPLFSKIEVHEHMDGRIPYTLRVEEGPVNWKWVVERKEELEQIFANTPFFHLRLGTVKTDEAFMDADVSFIWPDAMLAHNPEFTEFTFQNEKGLLGSMGYHVGEKAASADERRAILSRVFHAHQLNFPKELPDHYKNGWGLPVSSHRLRKIADSISFFCKSFVARHGCSYDAVDHWESDLAWLKREFYDNHFSFPWPDGNQGLLDQFVKYGKRFAAENPDRIKWINEHLEGKEKEEALFREIAEFVEGLEEE